MVSDEPADRLLDLARNLGIDDETFAGTLAEVMAKADADLEWGQPHEVIAEMRARLLVLATGPGTLRGSLDHPVDARSADPELPGNR